MRYLTRSDLSDQRDDTIRRIYLSLLWALGLFLGWLIGNQTDDSVIMNFRDSLISDLSFPGALISRLFPFILSFAAVRFKLPVLLVPVVFLKAYSFGFCFRCISVSFSDAAWLVDLLYLSADSCCVILMIWFLLRNTRFRSQKSYIDAAFCIVLLIAIAIFEYTVISPFTGMLFN